MPHMRNKWATMNTENQGTAGAQQGAQQTGMQQNAQQPAQQTGMQQSVQQPMQATAQQPSVQQPMTRSLVQQASQQNMGMQAGAGSQVMGNLNNGGQANNNANSNNRDPYGNPNVQKKPMVNGIPVVAVQKNGDRDIEAFQLANGAVLGYPQMIQAVQQNATTGLIAQQGNDGNTIIRSAPDAYSQNNLDNLPTFGS